MALHPHQLFQPTLASNGRRLACAECGRSRPKKRKVDIVCMPVGRRFAVGGKNWRVIRMAKSYRVQRTMPIPGSNRKVAAWQDVRKIGRTRNEYIDQEMAAAERCMWRMIHEHEKETRCQTSKSQPSQPMDNWKRWLLKRLIALSNRAHSFFDNLSAGLTRRLYASSPQDSGET